MSERTAVLLPSTDWDPSALAAELVGAGMPCVVPDIAAIPADLPAQLADARRIALTAIWLNTHAVPGPITVVAHGSGARLLPAFGFSQRAGHRLVVGYVIVDAAPPAPAQDWPDAPVWWVHTSAAPQAVAQAALSAQLRGFRVIGSDNPAEVVLAFE
jgi:hypothetical protein